MELRDSKISLHELDANEVRMYRVLRETDVSVKRVYSSQ